MDTESFELAPVVDEVLGSLDGDERFARSLGPRRSRRSLEHDPKSILVPALGYGFSDGHFLREAYGAVAYGFIPFPHADPLVNLMTKHGTDERVLADDVEFQALAALAIARHPLV